MKKEKLQRQIKVQKLRIQNTIVLERLTLGIMKIKSPSRRKRASRVIPTLLLIKIRPRIAPTEDRIVTLQLNYKKNLGRELQSQAREFDLY